MVRVHLLLKLKPPKKNLLMCVVLLFVLIIAFVDVAVLLLTYTQTHSNTHRSVHFNICAKIVNGNRINRVQWMWKKSLVSVIHSFIHSFVRSLVRSLAHPFICLLIRSRSSFGLTDSFDLLRTNDDGSGEGNVDDEYQL